jgi:hypothetical protein
MEPVSEGGDLGGISGSSSLRSPEPVPVSAHSGNDPGREEKPYSFDELADPVLKALRFAYKLERRNLGRNVPWNGPRLGKSMRASCIDFKDRLRSGTLAYAEEDQGRDALEEIVSIAIQLGIEQGRRLQVKEDGQAGGLRWRLKTAQLFLCDSDTRPKAGDAKQGSTRE